VVVFSVLQGRAGKPIANPRELNRMLTVRVARDRNRSAECGSIGGQLDLAGHPYSRRLACTVQQSSLTAKAVIRTIGLTSVNRRGTVSQVTTKIGTVREPPSCAAGVAERWPRGPIEFTRICNRFPSSTLEQQHAQSILIGNEKKISFLGPPNYPTCPHTPRASFKLRV